MNSPLADVNDRLDEVVKELNGIYNGESPRRTIKPGESEAFDHGAWLEAEREALAGEREDFMETTNTHGEFIPQVE